MRLKVSGSLEAISCYTLFCGSKNNPVYSQVKITTWKKILKKRIVLKIHFKNVLGLKIPKHTKLH